MHLDLFLNEVIAVARWHEPRDQLDAKTRARILVIYERDNGDFLFHIAPIVEKLSAEVSAAPRRNRARKLGQALNH